MEYFSVAGPRWDSDRFGAAFPALFASPGSTWMCDYGRLNYRFVNSSKRLRWPLIAIDGTPSPVEWSEALPLMEKTLSRLGELAIEHYHKRGGDRIHLTRESMLDLGGEQVVNADV
jgi:NADH dehydrogenase/NADH:ubiquinone oxidoreductase subunit G